MSRSKPKRRWLQFSLRSVLLLTLAVALWLGYEVHQARQVERTIAGLAALGGSAECELTGWSLLRLCGVPGYGRRIVRAEIPGSAAEEAIALLRGSRGLREVQVTYDGTYDPAPSWKALIAALPNVRVQPRAEQQGDFHGDELVRFWNRRRSCFRRIEAKAVAFYPGTEVRRLFDSASVESRWFLLCEVEYRPLRLEDGSLAEVLSSRELFLDTQTVACFAALVVDDECVEMRGFSMPYFARTFDITFVEPIHGDPELCFRLDDFSTSASQRIGVYKIACDGFKSLLSEDISDIPANGEDDRPRAFELTKDATELTKETAASALPPARLKALTRASHSGR